jgi:hypothetical protein
MMAGLEQNQIAGLASGILLYGKRIRRRLENTMFFCVLLCSLPCMELLLLLAAAAAPRRRHHCAAVRCCGDGKQQNVFSNRITHFGGAASKTQ